MIAKKLALVGICLVASSAFADDAALPQKMEGRWGNRQNKAEVELIQMESATKAKLNVVFWDGCTRRGETTAELKEGSWEFIAPGGVRCDDIAVKMAQLPGKNRFEGTTATPRGNSTVYLEW